MISIRRICVIGDNAFSNELRVALAERGFVLSLGRPTFTVDAVVEAADTYPTIDSIDSPLERTIQRHLRRLTPSGRVHTQELGGVRRDNQIRIVVPPQPEEASAAVDAIVSAFEDYAPRPKTKTRDRWTWPPSAPWEGALLVAILVLLVLGLVQRTAHAQGLHGVPPGIVIEHARDERAVRQELALVEKDRQIAKLQYDDGRRLLEADMDKASAQLTLRALPLIDRLRALIGAPAGAPFNWTTQTFDDKETK